VNPQTEYPKVNRSVIVRDIELLRTKIRKLREQPSPSRESSDEIDVANGCDEQSRRLANLLLLERKLEAAEDLLKDVDQGTPFICRECHEPIGEERAQFALENKMYAALRLCVACAGGAKNARKKNGR